MLSDIRYLIRVLVKSPAFTLVAVLTLALGIGANTAIFSVVNSVLLHALPYPQAGRLVLVLENAKGFGEMATSYSNFLDWAAQNKVFESQAVVREDSFTLTGAGEPEHIRAIKGSVGIFSTMGVSPAIGRAFLPDEDRRGAGGVVILTDGLWKRRFGADPAVIGRSLRLDQKPYTVIGVMPSDFRMPMMACDLLIPVGLDADMGRWSHYLTSVARLKPGVSMTQAQSNLNGISQALQRQYPDSNGGWSLQVQSLQGYINDQVGTALLVLLGAVGLVLLIACANIANLLLARATTRRREFAIRAALGAGRLRVVRQMLTESVLLALMGGGVGLLVASWGIDFLVSLKPADMPLAETIHLDSSMLLFTLGVSIATGLIFGITPAFESWRLDLNESLKEGGRTAGTSSRHALRKALVVCEIALSLVLSIGAGLLIKSFINVSKVNPGFRVESVLTMELTLPKAAYSDDVKTAAFYDRLLENAKHLPGINAAGAASNLPLSSMNWETGFYIEGQPKPARASDLQYAEASVVAGDYFQTMGMRLLRGRFFSEMDRRDSPKVIIIDENLAAKYWPNQDPVGKRMFIIGGSLREVVGVVGHIKYTGLDRDTRVEVFTLFTQMPYRDMYLTFRTSGDPAAMSAAISNTVHALDKDLALYDVRTMQQLVSRSLSMRRFSVLLLVIFAGLALLLAGVGIYGVMAYSVAQRSHEMGIRMALGARAADVRGLVVRQTMQLAFIGVVIGLAAAFALTRVMSSLLFGVTATDPPVFTGISVLLVVVALLASYVPARRATRVDPIVTLRYE